ncbi:MAG: DUF1127 domain-containing protein [Acetobacteraceae bacterium]|nr:DUF1127 domain-containing protein [Acetobacteraceae bacterium]
MVARITREETALLLNLTSPVPTEAELIRLEEMRVQEPAIGRGIAGMAKAAWRAIREAFARLAAYPERMRVLHHLSAMSERELADIGLTRDSLPRVFDEDFGAARARSGARSRHVADVARAV